MVLRILQIIIITLLVVSATALIIDFRKNKEDDMPAKKYLANYPIGFIVNFFDVLGIGSFAPTLALYNLVDLEIEERKIGGTLNAGVAPVVLLEAILFVSSVEVDMKLLVLMLVSAIAGTFIGVRLNARIEVNTIRIIMAIGLAMAAFLMLAGKAGIYPIGGDAMSLSGIKLIVACVTSFVLGIALMFGIGNYAPCMAVVYMLGLSPIVAFPIMMCMGGLCSTSSSLQSIRNGLLVRKAAFGMMAGGFLGVIVAFFLVKSMSVSTLTWVVIVAVSYASISLFTKVAKSRKTEKAIVTEAAE